MTRRQRTARKPITIVSLALCGAFFSYGQAVREPHTFFREQIGLTGDQITLIDRGKAVALALPTRTPAEIFIFGAVYVNAFPDEYLKHARRLDRLRKLPDYIGIGEFSNPPVLEDLEGFTLEPDDIRNLRNCRPGRCKVQLSAQEMQKLQEAANWSATGASARVNDGIRKMALELLLRYQEGGNRSLPIYQDRDDPVHLAEQLQSLLSRADAMPIYLPELNRYLLEYPNGKLTNVESMFYWEKVAFGLKPTIRVNHALIYRSTGPRGPAHVVAVKQLYASHYFELALDITAAVPANGRPEDKGFYLISLKGSTQQGLTGFTGSLLRRVIVSKTRTAQENTLMGVKKLLEQPTN